MGREGMGRARVVVVLDILAAFDGALHAKVLRGAAALHLVHEGVAARRDGSSSQHTGLQPGLQVAADCGSWGA